MINRLAILGASGHGKVIAELALLNGYNEIHFFDDNKSKLGYFESWQILGNTELLIEKLNNYSSVVVAIGNNQIRLEKFNSLRCLGVHLPTLIHPSASVSKFAKIGFGNVVMANASINPFSKVGHACIINTNSSIDHDCILHDGVHISPGANLAGGVIIGTQSWVGIGSQINQLVTIGDNSTIGAGSTVISNVSNGLTVVGTPATPI